MWLGPVAAGSSGRLANTQCVLSAAGSSIAASGNGVTVTVGENIEPLVRANQGMTPIGVYIAGYADVDGDSIVDCIDPDIAPTVDNVDADFIPDRFDPDLRVNHRPYS